MFKGHVRSFALAVVVLWSGIAHASLTANDVAFGLRSITAGSFTLPDTIDSDSTTGDLLDHIVVTGTGCGVVTVVPAAALPQLITDVTPLDIDVKFDPVDRTAVSCTVTLFDMLNNELGNFAVGGDGAGPAISVPASTAFGNVRVAGGTSASNVVITNDGEETLSITNLAIDLGDYTFTTAPTFPITIAAGANTPVNVTFNPGSSGARSAILTITSNNTGGASTTTNLTGTGTNAVINVTDVNFADVTDNTTSTVATTITNTGTPLGTLTITSATISGGSWFTFADNGNSCAGQTTCNFASLTVDGTPKTVDVRCSPLSTDPLVMQTATLTFTSDADSGDNLALLTCIAGRPNITGVPAALPFGDIVINTSSAPQTVTIQNTGNRNLTYTATKSGGAYTLAGSCVTGCTVTPGNSDSFSVTFSPTLTGQQDITVTVASNDPDSPMKTINVTGRGVAPAISGPTNVQFNDVEVGKTSASKPLTVTNSGTSTLTITSGSVQSGTSDYTIVNPPASLVVAPGNTATWDIVCNPSLQGARPGTFRILSNAQNAATLDVPLACNGTRGFLTVSPTTLAFGNVPQDTTVDLMVMLSNTGNLPVTGITAAVNPNNVGYSVVASTLPASLTAGSNAMVTIRFQPTATETGGNATVTFQGAFGAAPVQTTQAVLSLTGTGQTNNVALSTTSIDFGSFRYDQQPTHTFCITNTGQSSTTIQSAMFVPNAGTASNEFAVTLIRKQATCGTAGSTVTLPNTLTAGQILEVTVRAQPANRTGPLNGDLKITTTLPVNPVKTVTLAANSITAMLTLLPGATVNFGNVDIQGAPQMQTVRLRNTGAAPLDLGSFARTPNSAFTFTLPSGSQTVQPNQEVSFAVTYTPTVALAVDETVTITHSILGDILAPSMGMIVLRGHPIDRDLTILGGAPLYPDTFRNPGTDGPVRVVQINNSGTAPLTISSVKSTDETVWKVLDPDATVVPPGATLDVRVRFEPIGPGRADAKLQIINDDVDGPPPITPKTTEVPLSGNCVARGVTLGPERIDLGYVEIGATLTQEDILKVIRTDMDHTFTLSKIAIEGDDQFAVAGFTDGMQLEAMERDFDVTFTPRVAGPASAKIQLFLDQDPEHQAEIEVTGTAVFVDARGGGGCSTGGGSGFGAIIVVLLIVLRRRAAAVAVLAVAATAAQADDNIVLSVFEPTPATSTDGFQLQSAMVGKHGEFVLGAVYSYASDPLLHIASSGGEHGVITGSSLLDVGVAIALLDSFELGATMPFYSQSGQARGSSLTGYTADPADGTATGDIRVHAKVSVIRKDLSGNGAFGLSGAIGLTFPTATDGMLTGTDDPSARLLALATLVPGAFGNRITLTANAGAVIRAPAAYKNIEQKSGVMWGLGASVRIADPLWLAGEMYGEFTPSGHEEMDGSKSVLAPIEWLGGINWRPDRRFMVSLAAGRGLTSAAGAPALRGVFALTVTPYASEMKPLHPPPKEDVTDTDGDGILDRDDQCDNEPEDKDLFDDTDGCPDPDNDKDGIADAQDRCPLEAEDKDAFQDDDGCPDKDNDGDKIADAMDKCPNEPEDNDGFQDGDGCPDPDNDGDGVPDANDKCPAQKETINGNQDNDGCPDSGMSLVAVTLDRFDLLESIQFSGDKVKSSSYNLLGQIAATLRARPDILRVRLAVHVPAGRDDEKDQQLSDRRAASLREWLVQWGIDAKRLEVRGFGSSKPLGGAAAANERVEIVIMDKK
jgi:outer membrane protein OmpA-like peptidoglycan-associated protein